jgi:hypothetical protein
MRAVMRVGRVLRRTNIDELPQLVNVLLGEMSIVGPRPHPIALNEAFAERIHGAIRSSRALPAGPKCTAIAEKLIRSRRCGGASSAIYTT